MIGKKINQLATELAPVSTDLTIIGDPISGVSKKITLAQLGAIFSGAVSFYTNLAGFPATGDINVIYCAKDTQKLYLWSGSAYTEVFPSQALLDTYQLRSEKGVSNGYASLDSSGKVPISQLPSSIMEYKGTWNAATNTPTLANGTGDTGDVYICNVAGTVDFGAGPITFAVGDYVIYSGSIWQRSSGAVGTVTSVAASITGDAIGITGSPVTTSGTLALAFAGTSAQYINGAGSLTTFPTSLISGTGNVNAIPKFTANTVLGNSVMEDDGNFVSMRGLKLNTIGGTGNTINFQQASGIIAAGLGYSSIGAAGSTGIQFYLDQNVTERIFVLDTTTITSNTARTYSMPNSNGTLALTSDIPSLTGYVPYTGATANVDLGTHSLSAYDLIIDHTSGSGVAASITKGGNGEALTVVKSSGSGNAASITGGVTLLSELHLTTDLADAYIASASNWNDAYNLRHNAVTIGTANGLSLSTQVLSLALASGSTTGALSSTDWTTFNSKQSALTNPVTGTGTTNYLPKFTGTSTIGNSIVSDNGSRILINTGTTNQNTTINASKIAMSRTSDGAEVVYFSKNTDLGTEGTANINGYDGIQFRTQGAESVKATLTASGNLGLGVTPSAWGSAFGSVLQFKSAGSNGGGALTGSGGSNFRMFANTFYDGSYKYIVNGTATQYEQDGYHAWYTAPSGTAGNAISFTQAMTLTSAGELCVGRTSAYGAGFLVNVQGNIYASAAIVAGSSVTATSVIRALGGNIDGTLGDCIYFENSGYPNTQKNRIRSSNSASNTGNLLTFETSNGTVGSYNNNQLVLRGDGNVGIGTTSPSAKLDVNGQAMFRNRTDIYNNGYGLIHATNSTLDQYVLTEAKTNGFLITTGKNGAFSVPYLALGVQDGESMRITSGGLVGIGTTSPSDYLGSYFGLAMYNASNSVLSIATGSTGQSSIYFSNGTGGNRYNGYIEYMHPSNAMTFATAQTERARITSGGILCVGKTDGTFGNVGHALFQNGQVSHVTSSDASLFLNRLGSTGDIAYFYSNSSPVGSISVTGSATAYNTTSDYRLKTDLKDFSGLDLVSKIKAYDYEWKSDKSRSYGVIAHELQSVINYAVTGVKDGEKMQGVDYSKIVPVLIKAIQELNDKIK